MSWLSGLRSRKLRPMQSPISIPTRSGRAIRVARGRRTATPVSIRARLVSFGRWITYTELVRPASLEDFRPAMPKLMERTIADFEINFPTDYEKHGSLLRGDMGAALLAMRLAPTSSLADLVYGRAEANNDLPIRELMWGMPGSRCSPPSTWPK